MKSVLLEDKDKNKSLTYLLTKGTTKCILPKQSDTNLSKTKLTRIEENFDPIAEQIGCL